MLRLLIKNKENEEVPENGFRQLQTKPNACKRERRGRTCTTLVRSRQSMQLVRNTPPCGQAANQQMETFCTLCV